MSQTRLRSRFTRSAIRRGCPSPISDTAPEYPAACRLWNRSGRSLDHLICAQQQRRRNGEAERACCLEVDRQLELRGLLHGKIAGLGSFQNLVDIPGAAPEQVRQTRTVGNESAVDHVLL